MLAKEVLLKLIVDAERTETCPHGQSIGHSRILIIAKVTSPCANLGHFMAIDLQQNKYLLPGFSLLLLGVGGAITTGASEQIAIEHRARRIPSTTPPMRPRLEPS